MANLRLTHPTRATLPFRQLQQDRSPTNAVANITADLGDDRAPLVHVETRERERSITGRVTAPRRARNSGTGDWQQALADYALELESHIDEFQGTGYTLVDDLRDESLSSIIHAVEWTYRGGEPYDLAFDATVSIGRGTFGDRPRDPDTATVNDGMDVIATVGGVDLPGFREMRVSKEFGIEVSAVYGRETAENNDIIGDSGVEHRFQFGGTHTGSVEERRAADDALRDLINGNRYDLVTHFPGYTKTGKVINYDSNFQAEFGAEQHRYELTFVVAREDGQQQV